MSASSKPGGLAAAPMSTVTLSCLSSGFARRLLAGNDDQRLLGLLGRRPHQVHQDRVAALDAAVLDRLVTGPPAPAAAPAPGRPPHPRPATCAALDRGVIVARLERGTVSNVGRELERRPSSTMTSLMSGVSTGSTPRSRSASSTARGIRPCATSWRIWLAEALPHDLGRHFAGPEPGNPRRLAVLRVTLAISASTTSGGISTVRFRRV